MFDLQIQDGCSNRCAFCTSNYRKNRDGNEESLSTSWDDIKNTLKHMEGKDVRLCGKCIVDYNWEGMDLVALVERIGREFPDVTVFITAIEPSDKIDMKKLFSLPNMNRDSVLVSAQGLEKSVLEKMNSSYSVESIRKTVEAIGPRRAIIEYIIGFAPMTQETIDNIKSMGIIMMSLRPYVKDILDRHFTDPEAVAEETQAMVKASAPEESRLRNEGGVMLVDYYPQPYCGNLIIAEEGAQ